MRYFLFVLVLVAVFSHRPPDATSCCGTLYNCLPDEIEFCLYDGSSFWDTIVTLDSDDLVFDESGEISCSSTTGCYVIVEETSGVWECVDYQADGTIDCDNTACIGYDESDAITWTGGGSGDAYKCEDNVCVAD